VDKVILFMFALLFSMCMCGCVYYGFWTANRLPDAWYLGPFKTEAQYNPDKPVISAVTNFITVFILYGKWRRQAIRGRRSGNRRPL
jgi:hypothetical protein